MRSRSQWQADIEESLKGKRRPIPKSFHSALAAPGETLICEIKRKAPSTSGLAIELDPLAVAQDYERNGAGAISVLTEPDYFAGSLGDLQLVASGVGVPVLRKDFIIDELQILEARANGASAILLIVAILEQRSLAALMAFAATCELDVLLEVHDGGELRRALAAQAKIIGVNNRNLKSMQIDLATGESLLRKIPAGIVRVAESGIRSRTDVVRLREAGADAFLIGTSLMQSNNISAKIKELRGI